MDQEHPKVDPGGSTGSQIRLLDQAHIEFPDVLDLINLFPRLLPRCKRLFINPYSFGNVRYYMVARIQAGVPSTRSQYSVKATRATINLDNVGMGDVTGDVTSEVAGIMDLMLH